MDPPAVRKFLKQVGRELRDLGPFERHKALSEIRSDITDLAMDGHPVAPEKRELDRASRSMPSPREVAQMYLASAKPPLLMIELSLVFNLLLSLGCLAAGVWLYSSLSSYQGSKTLPAMFILLLTASGLFGLAVYGSAFIRPRIAARWRYAVLPAIVVAVVFDAILGTIAVVNLNWPPLVGILAPIATVFGGVYSIAYAHDQLPRLSVGDTVVKKGRDYFRTLGWHLRDLDRARRIAIMAELRNHITSSGIDLAGLGPKERYDRIVEVLGPPDKIASGYVMEAPAELSRNQRMMSGVLLFPAMIGIILGAIILQWGLSAETFGDAEQNLTLLGMVGSIGLLITSIGALAGMLHVRRAPMHWPDTAPPAAIFALIATLIIAAVFGGFPAGGILENTPRKAYTIDAIHHGPNGSLDAYWTTWSYAGMDSALGIPIDATKEDSVVTHLNQDRQVQSSETWPVKSNMGAPIAFDRVGASWAALYSEGFTYWSGMSTMAGNFIAPIGWNSVDGRIDGPHLMVSWLSYNPSAGSMAVASASLTLPDAGTEATWEKIVTAPQAETPWFYLSRVIAGENRTLATAALTTGNSSFSGSYAQSYLFDESGIELASIPLIRDEVALNGSDDQFNGTSVSIEGSHYIGGAFWIFGHNMRAVNGTAALRSWVLRVNATDGSWTTYELRRLTLPYLIKRGQSPSVGDPWFFFSQGTVADDESVFLVTVVVQGSIVLNPELGWTSYVTSGNMTASRFMTDGSLDFAVQLYDVPTGDPSFFPGTMISAYEGTLSVFFPDFRESSSGESKRVKTFFVTQLSHEVQEGEMTMGLAETLFLHYCLMQVSLSFTCVADGVAPGIAEMAFQVAYLDRGIFDWRGGEKSAIAKAPAILRLDARSGTTSIILIAPLNRPSDTVAGLLLVTVVAIASVLMLVMGYPRLRSRRTRKRGESDAQSMD